ncbi:Endo/exonuclease/phosphatase domain-containing protein [Aphis craccivora]|uniref:Endo/exonuclease/phosphatase domain-containing protein n=1 Tax=Aphis craccivora TaxID=307492 RepID=A0A6G0Z7N0_APHCR|nr:Endo/exonuclease/phosphatase domain-containing protein [Aphis craccivora]
MVLNLWKILTYEVMRNFELNFQLSINSSKKSQNILKIKSRKENANLNNWINRYRYAISYKHKKVYDFSTTKLLANFQQLISKLVGIKFIYRYFKKKKQKNLENLDFFDFFITRLPNSLNKFISNLNYLSSYHSLVLLTLDAEIASTTNNPFLSSGPVDWKFFQAKLDESFFSFFLDHQKKNQSKSHISLPSYLVNLIKAKRRVRSLWQRSKYPEHKTAYNHLSNDLKSQLAKYRSEQFSQYLSTLSPNNGSFWKITKKLTNQRENIPPLSYH